MSLVSIANAGPAPTAAVPGVRANAGDPARHRDLALGTLIATVLSVTFFSLSSGWSLIVTFVPGMAFAWLVFVWIEAGRVALPSAERFVPAFFAVLAIQFLHFAEEYATGFNTAFPELYGGHAYSPVLFVTFNMISYAVFAGSCLLVFYRGVRQLLMPLLFFVVYGAIGNAISHTWWVVSTGAYFPGFVTALAYWVAGPWLLHRLTGSMRVTLATTLAFGAVLVALLSLFAAL